MNDNDEHAQDSKSGFDLGLDWDDIGEAYVGALAALLTVSVLFLAGYGCRARRFRR